MMSTKQQAISLIRKSGSLQDAIKQCKQIIYMSVPNIYDRRTLKYELILKHLEDSTTHDDEQM